jgi:hypothetical protein
MQNIDDFIENTLDSHVQEKYQEDLQEITSSEALQIACEEFPELISAILQADTIDASVEAVEALREGVYDMFYEHNSEDVFIGMRDNLVYGGYCNEE